MQFNFFFNTTALVLNSHAASHFPIVFLLLGSPQDKLKLFFDMYDVNGDGKLDRAAFKKMMK